MTRDCKSTKSEDTTEKVYKLSINKNDHIYKSSSNHLIINSNNTCSRTNYSGMYVVYISRT